MKPGKVLYTARVRTVGGREGSARSDDGRIDLKFQAPGTPGTGTNPEQVFAAGWSACYLSAMAHVARQMKVDMPKDASVNAEVDLCNDDGAFFLRARLNVVLPGLDLATARQLAETAHGVCPYSKATHGNIEVETKVG